MVLSIRKFCLFGLVMAFLLQGCATLLGIKWPAPISKSEATNYLIKHNIDTSNVLFLKPNYFDTLRSKPFKPKWERGLRPIQCKIFNEKGDLIFQYSSCEGSLKRTKFFDKFPPENLFPPDSIYTLEDEIEMVQDFEPERELKDFITIIYWGTYTGIPGRRLVKKMVKELKRENVNTAIYKLNVDIIDE